MSDSIDIAAAPERGVRLFRVVQIEDDYLLQPVAVGNSVYMPCADYEARCSFSPHPKLDDSAGIWACKEEAHLPISFYKHAKLVIADVWLWGVVVEHELGFRAQYMRIIPDTFRGVLSEEVLQQLRMLYNDDGVENDERKLYVV
jgi:hypothetical protein